MFSHVHAFKLLALWFFVFTISTLSRAQSPNDPPIRYYVAPNGNDK